MEQRDGPLPVQAPIRSMHPASDGALILLHEVVDASEAVDEDAELLLDRSAVGIFADRIFALPDRIRDVD